MKLRLMGDLLSARSTSSSIYFYRDLVSASRATSIEQIILTIYFQRDLLSARTSCFIERVEGEL